MARKSPYVIKLTKKEREVLLHKARSYTSPYFQVVRAKLILLAAEGLENKEIGERLGLQRPIVSKWRKRFFERRLDGLEDDPRSGRPPRFSP